MQFSKVHVCVFLFLLNYYAAGCVLLIVFLFLSLFKILRTDKSCVLSDRCKTKRGQCKEFKVNTSLHSTQKNRLGSSVVEKTHTDSLRESCMKRSLYTVLVHIEVL